MSRAAAFFDLDKTLMAGSSGMQFARVATRHGLVSRRSWPAGASSTCATACAAPPTSARPRCCEVARELIAGVPARSLERMNPEVMAAILPRVYPQMLDEVYAHQDAGRADLHRQRRRQRRGRAAGHGARHGRRDRHPLRGRRGRRPSPAASTAPSSTAPGKVEAMEAFAAAARHRPRRLLRLLRLALRPADAARGRQPGRRQPGPAAGRDRPRGGLADDALRAARPPPGDRASPCSRRAGAAVLALRRRRAREHAPQFAARSAGASAAMA